jgi:predicted metal-dependent TIM-barrel fold hydrolase
MVRLIGDYGTDRILVNSAADWGRSDPLATHRTAQAMLAAGFAADEVAQVFWRNPVEFYGRSGRLELAEAEPVPEFAGNSTRRGGE